MPGAHQRSRRRIIGLDERCGRAIGPAPHARSGPWRDSTAGTTDFPPDGLQTRHALPLTTHGSVQIPKPRAQPSASWCQSAHRAEWDQFFACIVIFTACGFTSQAQSRGSHKCRPSYVSPRSSRTPSGSASATSSWSRSRPTRGSLAGARAASRAAKRPWSALSSIIVSSSSAAIPSPSARSGGNVPQPVF